jgi:hypothetical protein
VSLTTTEGSLALPALLALIHYLHAFLRTHTARRGALFLTVAYADIYIATDRARRRREEKRETASKHRGQEDK